MSSENDEKEDHKSNQEPSHYFLFIYWNPKDKRILVPKRWGYGLTINFANPRAIALLLALVVGVALLVKFL